MKRLSSIVLASSALAVFAAGCGADPAPASKTASQPGPVAQMNAPASAAAVTPTRRDTTSPTAGSIHIEDRILKACGNIPTAHFAFDSTEVAAEAQSSLDALARCFTTGPLAGKGMKLVGHADPRGETEYNFGLGQKRAGSVADFLGKKGMPKSHVETSSRGELESMGVDEQGWARDRRVDVFLAE